MILEKKSSFKIQLIKAMKHLKSDEIYYYYFHLILLNHFYQGIKAFEEFQLEYH